MAETDERLDIDRPEQFLRRERQVQRVGFVLLVLFVAGGALGVFGDGPLSQVSRRTGNLELRYERFARSSSHTSLAISVTTDAPDDTPVSIVLEREFLARLSILDMRPPSADVHFSQQHAVFSVPAAGGAAHLELHFKPEHQGLVTINVATSSGRSLQARQFIYF